MKTYRLAAIVMAAAIFTLSAAADEVMQISYGYGQAAQIKVADIESMDFREATELAAPEAVDLGLPSGTMWASCNIGGVNPADLGIFFAWGELNPRDYYSPDTYFHRGLSIEEMEQQLLIDSNLNLTPYFDTAKDWWGRRWRMPTKEEAAELVDCCSWEWGTLEGRFGCTVTGPNGNSIFLPAAGYRQYSGFNRTIYEGYYWTASAVNDEYSRFLYFDSSECKLRNGDPMFGFTVRPVTGGEPLADE